MGEISSEILIDLAYALGIGLFVGLEREHSVVAGGLGPHATPADRSDKQTASETVLGVRTFALLSLFGWGCAHAGIHWAWLPPVGLLVVGGFVVTMSEWRLHGVTCLSSFHVCVCRVPSGRVTMKLPLALPSTQVPL